MCCELVQRIQDFHPDLNAQRPTASPNRHNNAGVREGGRKLHLKPRSRCFCSGWKSINPNKPEFQEPGPSCGLRPSTVLVCWVRLGCSSFSFTCPRFQVLQGVKKSQEPVQGPSAAWQLCGELWGRPSVQLISCFLSRLVHMKL